MKLHRLILPAAVLALLGTAGSASAAILSGSVSGIGSYADPSLAVPLPGPTSFLFNIDTSRFQLWSTDGVSHALYSFFQTSDSQMLDMHYTTPSGPDRYTQGWSNEIELRNTATGQEVSIWAGSPHGGEMWLTLAGAPNAFFSGLDISTLHAGPLDLSRTHGSFRWFFNVDLDHPLAANFTTPVPEPDTAYFMGAMLLMGVVGRFAARRRSAAV